MAMGVNEIQSEATLGHSTPTPTFVVFAYGDQLDEMTMERRRRVWSSGAFERSRKGQK